MLVSSMDKTASELCPRDCAGPQPTAQPLRMNGLLWFCVLRRMPCEPSCLDSRQSV